jgi:hypothetical protein
MIIFMDYILPIIIGGILFINIGYLLKRTVTKNNSACVRHITKKYYTSIIRT